MLLNLKFVIKILFLECIVCFPFFAQTVSIQNDKNLNFYSAYPAEILAKELVQRMSNEELLAQILMFGWAGEEPSPLLTRWVQERHLGSVKVFGWNTENIMQVAKSIAFLQEKTLHSPFKIPLFVATDQEGGLIRHVKGKTSDTPGNLAIGASGYPIDAWYSGYYIGQELHTLGINMNFAPTVDLYSNLKSTVIGSRSFGADARFAGIMGVAFAEGSMAAGVLPTAKHFPGHGDTGADSHGKLPVINIDYTTLLERELVPFEYLIEKNIPAIMSGHLSFPLILESGEPASLSSFFLTDLLRKKMGFTGLIITDDMMMNGATTYTGALSEAFYLAIEAGNDILISSTTAKWEEPLWRHNVERLYNDEVFKNKVKEAAERVILTKLRYFNGENPAPLNPNLDEVLKNVPAPNAADFFTAVAARSITAYKKGTKFPYTKDMELNEKVLVVGQFQEFFNEAYTTYGAGHYFYFNYILEAEGIREQGQKLVERAQSYDTIIVCVANETSRAVAKFLKNINKPVIIISVLEPVHVLDFDWADTILLAYSYSNFSFRAVFSALRGDYTPEGRLPLVLSQ